MNLRHYDEITLDCSNRRGGFQLIAQNSPELPAKSENRPLAFLVYGREQVATRTSPGSIRKMGIHQIDPGQMFFLVKKDTASTQRWKDGKRVYFRE
jgi:hypothetical protein